MYFINQQGQYYASNQRINKNDIEVPQRPDDTYVWTGDGWEVDPEKVRDGIKLEIVMTDQNMVRTIDDLFEILLKKNILDEKDIPDVVKKKLEERIMKRELLK